MKHQKFFLMMIMCLVSLSFISGDTISQNFSTNLISHYSFELSSGDILSSVNQTFNATNHGATRGVSGLKGNGIFFDGVNDYVDIDNIVSSLDLDGNWTFNYWVYENSSTSGENDDYFTLGSSSSSSPVISLKCDSDDDPKALVRNNANTLRLMEDVSLNFRNGDWNMLTLVHNGSKYTLYFDGVAVDDENGGLTTFTLNMLTLGARRQGSSTPGNFAKTLMDEVSLWSTDLSPTQINQIYNDGEGLNYSGESSPPEPTDDSPSVILTSPADSTFINSSSNTLVCSVTDDQNVNTTNLYLDGVLNQSNYSGVNGSYSFEVSGLSHGSHNWTCEGIDNNSQATKPSVRTFIYVTDIDFPPEFFDIGLVAFYDFENKSWIDRSGNGNNGITYGNESQIYIEDGIVGNGIFLNNIANSNGEGIEVDSIDTGVSWTFFAWFKTNISDISVRHYYLLDSYAGAGASNRCNFGFRYEHMKTDVAGPDYIVEEQSALNDSSWHFMAVTLDGNTLTSYIDAVQVNQTTGVTPKDISGDVMIGVINDAGGSGTAGFVGSIDEMAIFNGVVNSSLISEYYNYGNPPIYPNSTGSCTESLINTTWSDWSNQTSCRANNTILQNRSLIQYDENVCGETENITFWDYQEIACDYCNFLNLENPNQSFIYYFSPVCYDAESVFKVETYNQTWIDFDGDDDRIIVGDYDVFSPSDNEGITISIWVKFNSSSVPNGVRSSPISKGDTGQYEYEMRVSNDTLTTGFMVMQPSGSTHCTQSGDDLEVGKWYNLVGTYKNNSDCSLYINGVSQGVDDSLVGVMANGGANFTIASREARTNPTNASIDDVVVFNRSLSASQVARFYSSNTKGSNYGEGVPSLSYHRIEEADNYSVILHPDNFSNQMAWLDANGFTTIDYDDFKQYTEDTFSLPNKPVILVFDDARESVFENAKTIMDSYGFIGVLGVITDRVGESGYMTWDEIQNCSDSGWQIASHSLVHSDFLTLNESERLESFENSFDAINGNLSIEPSLFIYPYNSNNETTDSECSRFYSMCSGYSTSIDSVNAFNYKVANLTSEFGEPLGLRRKNVLNETTLQEFIDGLDFFNDKVLHYSFNENNGSVVHDLSDSSINGTMMDDASWNNDGVFVEMSSLNYEYSPETNLLNITNEDFYSSMIFLTQTNETFSVSSEHDDGSGGATMWIENTTNETDEPETLLDLIKENDKLFLIGGIILGVLFFASLGGKNNGKQK
jgi:peptidoglycan/xylan/chitin deacetylase (PgdA/CDA1 family)